VRLHVAAKRCLCAVDAGYNASLSDASRQSLLLQGGVMTEAERVTFEENPSFADAVRLRRWDDTAKVMGLNAPTLMTYQETVTYLSQT
jgi:predicted HD phosphohydrolase